MELLLASDIAWEHGTNEAESGPQLTVPRSSLEQLPSPKGSEDIPIR